MKILKFINTIKLAIIHKKLLCTINYHKSYLNFLKKLIDINLIKSYQIINNRIYIRLVYLNNEPVFNQMTNFYKKRSQRTISVKFLKKNLKNLNKGLYLIMTSKGLKTHLDLIKENGGGILLFKLAR
jgi:ribosomal protein S8